MTNRNASRSESRRSGALRAIRGTGMFILLVWAGAAVSLTAQDNPLDFTDNPARIGIEFGFVSTWQSGSYFAGCHSEPFEKGAGANFVIAAAYDRPVGGLFRIEGLAGYQTSNIESNYVSREEIAISTSNGPSRAAVDFDNIGRLNLSYLFVQPGLKFYPVKQLYVGAGASAMFNIAASSQFQKDILSRTVQLNELGLSEVFYSETESSDPYSKVYPNTDREDAAGVLFNGVFMVGAEFGVRVGPPTEEDRRDENKLNIGPRLQYVLPFVQALSGGDSDLSLHHLQFLIGLRYNI